VKVKFTHNQDQVWTSSKEEHPSHYFLPSQHWFAPQEHPTTVVEAQDKHLGLAQVENVFQNFDMLSNRYLIHGKPLNEIYNAK
jgi:hypothetical protein